MAAACYRCVHALPFHNLLLSSVYMQHVCVVCVLHVMLHVPIVQRCVFALAVKLAQADMLHDDDCSR